MSTETTSIAEAPPARQAHEAPTRVRGLDGLRAVAVVSVVTYHVHASWLPGGFLGVDLFFVISGYLITSLLTAERARTGRFRLGAFWIRRARRLLPAMWAVLTLAACTATLAGGDTYAGLRGNVVAALTYSSNWWQIAQHDAYFTGVGGKPVLQHLWSLAVEEQFYVLWPLLLWCLMAVLRRRRDQAAVTLALAAASFTAMALMYTPDTDTSRVYYGTDTHGGGLLLGAAAALVLPLARATALRGRTHLRALDALGGGGLLALVVAAWLLDGTGAAVYQGGLALSCVAAVAVTVAAAGPGRFARVLSARPLVWVGRRSYGIYLWHWPIIACLTGVAPGFAASAAGRVTMLGLTAVFAVTSYRVLEEPLIRLGVRGYLTQARRWFVARAEARPRQALAMAVAGAGVVTVACIGVSHAPTSTGLEAQIAAGERAAAAAAPHTSAAPAAADMTGGRRAAVAKTAPGAHDAPGVPGDEITAIGDSVMLASTDALEQAMPGIDVVAKVGRQMDAAPDVLRQLAAQGKLRRVVVIGLGTNGDFSDATIADVLRITGPSRTVAFINTYVPRSWESTVNSALRRAVRTHPGTVLVDWHDAIAKQPQRLWTDNTHPRPSGTGVYADAIRSALESAAGSTAP
ncbi:acyltransferase family protein [Streptomyces sp. ICBB 8177]|uniref:acyltransferase family protein n=1 Tax=Streptomyces sp. ICBB 8177 TaxID=563922 RepID=UPI000D683425|nr:acyltransferase family protein [Streptomyces sp. ICBB 8177]PWI42721.1 lipopolysaccharide modification acyltransferase [Streptomyces sp. ICBB 8177]